MTTEVDFWDQPADDVPEPDKPSFSSIPDGANVILRTTNRDDKETVRPVLRENTNKSTGSKWFTLKVPMVIIGGDEKIEASHVGRYFFPELYVAVPTAEHLQSRIDAAKANGNEGAANRLTGQLKSRDKYPVDPELYNLILDTLAPIDAPTAERWGMAYAILAAKGKELGFSSADKSIMYAAAYQAVLMDKTFEVIGRTYTRKQKPGSTFVPNQTVGSFSENSEEQRTRRKVAPINKEEF